MDKILAINTIKNVFSALGAKTSDSNYGVALLDKTSGEPKGFMGMSDLASVLGVPVRRNGQGNGVYSLGNLTAYGSIRVIGVDFNQYKGNTDVSIYGNGNIANLAAIGTKGSIDFYKNGAEIFIQVPSGSSNNFIVIGAFPTPSTLPSGATVINVATS